MQPSNTQDTAQVNYVTHEELGALVESAPLLVVDFTATWCGPCRVVAPIMEKLAAEHGDRVKVVKVDIDQHRESATQHQVKSLPTVLIFKAGEAVERVIGSQPHSVFAETLGRHL